jgi:hypothetical protein
LIVGIIDSAAGSFVAVAKEHMSVCSVVFEIVHPLIAARIAEIRCDLFKSAPVDNYFSWLSPGAERHNQADAQQTNSQDNGRSIRFHAKPPCADWLAGFELWELKIPSLVGTSLRC